MACQSVSALSIFNIKTGAHIAKFEDNSSSSLGSCGLFRVRPFNVVKDISLPSEHMMPLSKDPRKAWIFLLNSQSKTPRCFHNVASLVETMKPIILADILTLLPHGPEINAVHFIFIQS